jgi:TetR/AcrR family transcriptional regulator, cholesterol catabolism regulator
LAKSATRVVGATSPRPSRRERNKQDKLQRIKKAAAELFAKRGFAKATTAEIAERADVSAGTLFLYARTKEALLCMVMIDDMHAAFERALRSMPASASLPEKMAHIYGHTLRFHARSRELSAHFVREVGMMREPLADTEVSRVLGSIVEELVKLVALDQQAQMVRADISAPDLSACFAALYYQVLSQFLNGQSTLEQALKALKLRMKVGYEGMRTSART